MCRSGNNATANANANGSDTGQIEQAGIQTGDGGYNISVKGNADLKDMMASSDADPSKKNLSAGTPSVSDIQISRVTTQ